MRIGDQQHLALEKGQQVLLELPLAKDAAPGHGVDGLAAAVARDQDAVEFARDAALACRAAAFARRPVELARTLLRFQDEHFVGFDDAVQARRPVFLDPLEKAVAPAERGVAMHLQRVCRRAHRARCEQGVEKIAPFGTQSQSRQRRAGEVVEGAPALTAAIALQAIGLPVPLPAGATAVRATAPGAAPLFDQREHRMQPRCRPQGVEHPQPLRLIQSGQGGEPLLESGRFHDQSLSMATGIGPCKSSAVQCSSTANGDSAFFFRRCVKVGRRRSSSGCTPLKPLP
jgi:hypothetical protein